MILFVDECCYLLGVKEFDNWAYFVEHPQTVKSSLKRLSATDSGYLKRIKSEEKRKGKLDRKKPMIKNCVIRQQHFMWAIMSYISIRYRMVSSFYWNLYFYRSSLIDGIQFRINPSMVPILRYFTQWAKFEQMLFIYWHTIGGGKL